MLLLQGLGVLLLNLSNESLDAPVYRQCLPLPLVSPQVLKCAVKCHFKVAKRTCQLWLELLKISFKMGTLVITVKTGEVLVSLQYCVGANKVPIKEILVTWSLHFRGVIGSWEVT